MLGAKIIVSMQGARDGLVPRTKRQKKRKERGEIHHCCSSIYATTFISVPSNCHSQTGMQEGFGKDVGGR